MKHNPSKPIAKLLSLFKLMRIESVCTGILVFWIPNNLNGLFPRERLWFELPILGLSYNHLGLTFCVEHNARAVAFGMGWIGFVQV